MTAPDRDAHDRAGRCRRAFVPRADGQTVKAVDRVSGHVREGEFVCLVGPSGCGKSTLLQMVAGLLPIERRHRRRTARRVTDPGRERGMVFQRDSVFPWMRVIDNVEYGLKCRGVPPAERRAIARTLSRARRAGPCRARLAARALGRHAEAGGHRHRVRQRLRGAAARRAVRRARLRHQRQLHDVLLDLWGRPAAAPPTVLFVTHDVDEALTLADRIIVMRQRPPSSTTSASGASRPRDTDSLLLPEWWRIKHKLARRISASNGGRAPAARCGHERGVKRRADWMVVRRVFLALIVLWEILSLDLHRRGPARRADGRRAGRSLVHPHLPEPWPTIGRAASASRRSPTAPSAATSRRCWPWRRIRCDTIVRLYAASCSAARPWLLARPRRLVVALDARGSSICPCSSCARCRSWRWCRCSSSGSGPTSSARCCSSPMASAVIVFAGTVNAVRNVPQIYLDNARSLGALALAALPNRGHPGDLPGHALDHPAQPRRRLGRGPRRRISRAPSPVSATSSSTRSSSAYSTGCS